MGRGSGSIRPHLAVLLLLTGVLAAENSNGKTEEEKNTD